MAMKDGKILALRRLAQLFLKNFINSSAVPVFYLCSYYRTKYVRMGVFKDSLSSVICLQVR